MFVGPAADVLEVGSVIIGRSSTTKRANCGNRSAEGQISSRAQKYPAPIGPKHRLMAGDPVECEAGSEPLAGEHYCRLELDS